MASLKKHIRLSDSSIKTCAEASSFSGTINFSASVNSIINQFSILIEDNTPNLTKNEWNAFYCAFNGYTTNPDMLQEVDTLALTITESYIYDIQVTDFIGNNANCLKLKEKIDNWSISQKLAVIFKAQAFWRNQNPEEISDEEDQFLVNAMTNPSQE